MGVGKLTATLLTLPLTGIRFKSLLGINTSKKDLVGLLSLWEGTVSCSQWRKVVPQICKLNQLAVLF